MSTPTVPPAGSNDPTGSPRPPQPQPTPAAKIAPEPTPAPSGDDGPAVDHDEDDRIAQEHQKKILEKWTKKAEKFKKDEGHPGSL